MSEDDNISFSDTSSFDSDQVSFNEDDEKYFEFFSKEDLYTIDEELNGPWMSEAEINTVGAPSPELWKDIHTKDSPCMITFNKTDIFQWTLARKEFDHIKKRLRTKLALNEHERINREEIFKLLFGASTSLLATFFHNEIGLSHLDYLKFLQCYVIQSSYTVSSTELFSKDSLISCPEIKEKEYNKIWRIILRKKKLSSAESSSCRHEDPLWIKLESQVNEFLRYLTFEGREGKISVSIDDDKVYMELQNERTSDLFNLKFVKHGAYNSHEFIFNYLLPNGAKPEGTTVRALNQWPFTYDQKVSESDRRTYIESTGAPTLYVKRYETDSKQRIYATAFRNGTGGVVTGISSIHGKHDLDELLSLTIQPITLLQETADWHYMHKFSLTSSQASHSFNVSFPRFQDANHWKLVANFLTGEQRRRDIVAEDISPTSEYSNETFGPNSYIEYFENLDDCRDPCALQEICDILREDRVYSLEDATEYYNRNDDHRLTFKKKEFLMWLQKKDMYRVYLSFNKDGLQYLLRERGLTLQGRFTYENAIQLLSGDASSMARRVNLNNIENAALQFILENSFLKHEKGPEREHCKTGHKLEAPILRKWLIAVEEDDSEIEIHNAIVLEAYTAGLAARRGALHAKDSIDFLLRVFE